MGLFDPLVTAGLSRVEWIERTLGPNAALPFLRPLTFADDPAVRVRAMLATFRCLVRLGDGGEVITQSVRWTELRGGIYLDDIIDLCKVLLAQGHADAALALAAAEATRAPKARAIYLHARCLDRAGFASCMEVFKLAAERADAEPGAAIIGVAARVRRIERLASDPASLPQAVIEASQVDPEQGSAAHKLVIAAARLASPSRFMRASGLSILEELARKGRAEIADAAIRVAAQHADAHADGLTAVEADRLAVILKHWRDPKERESALARLRALVRIGAAQGEELDRALVEASEVAPETFPLLCRARAVLAGGGQGSYASASSGSASEARGSEDASPELRLAGLGLDIIVALRRARAQETVAALARASLAQKAFGRVAPPAVWTGASLALHSPERSVREGAIELAEVLLVGKGAPHPPPIIKLGVLAAALQVVGRADLASLAFRGAAAAKEPGASNDLVMGLVRHGWSLAQRGERDAALLTLREARTLYGRK